jgi:hypothetical protein
MISKKAEVELDDHSIQGLKKSVKDHLGIEPHLIMDMYIAKSPDDTELFEIQNDEDLMKLSNCPAVIITLAHNFDTNFVNREKCDEKHCDCLEFHRDSSSQACSYCGHASEKHSYSYGRDTPKISQKRSFYVCHSTAFNGEVWEKKELKIVVDDFDVNQCFWSSFLEFWFS